MTIPIEALPVLEILRRDVKRPSTLPTYTPDGLRWGQCCPMGLCDLARVEEPYEAGDFPADEEAIQAFANWWDGLGDAEFAIEAVWPKEVT